MKQITSRTNQKIKDAATYKKAHDGLFLIEGWHGVEMASKAGLAKEIYTTKDTSFKADEIYLVTEEIIEKLSISKNPEGVVALCRQKKEAPLSSKRVLMLEEVQDPGNVGTLLRTALSFGFHDVILSGGCDPYNGKAIASSQGAIFSLNILRRNSQSAIKELKANGYFVMATALKNSLPAEGYSHDGKIALIFGNEGQGLKEETIADSDVSLRISMEGIDSLNVGVAGGILMHQFGAYNK
ncbi:MAG: RNA methyltransferase [Bacilli bacterium]|nr:RNA methyltransferase [Bacilli bacterium]